MAASGESSSVEVYDITQCSICLDTFIEPKALPCLHTFCLQCLDKHCEDKKQKEVACPLCRKVFTIPEGGNKHLPTNVFILQLLQVKQSTGGANDEVNSKLHLCELCSDAETEIPSTSYCIECSQYLCDRCSAMHKKSKASMSHEVVRKADIPSVEERRKLNLSYCDKHPNERNRLYCNDCALVTCHVCLVDTHYGHKLTDVNNSAEKFRKQLKDDIENVSASSFFKLNCIKHLKFDARLVLKKIDFTENEISQKYDQLVSLLQSNKCQLMAELNEFKEKILKEVGTKKDEIERECVIRESFKRYCQEMMDKGTACDISRTAHDLHARAEELVKTQDVPDRHKLSEIKISFKPSLSTMDSNIGNLLGELVFIDGQKFDVTQFLGGLTVRHVIPPCTDQPVTGITVLGSEVFVVRETSQVYVYKSGDFTPIRYLSIIGSKELTGLISCSHFNCLYAVDAGQKIIYRYDLNSNVVSNWAVGGTCYRLSLTKRFNVLATLYSKKRKIQGFTTHGNFIKDICLDDEVELQWHCIQLSTGNYVACHEGTHHRVCIVDQNGRIIQSYGGLPGSGVGQINSPRHLIVDKHDNILVADSCNNKLQLLSAALKLLGDLVIPGHKLSGPNALHFDELNHRLYVGEYGSGRVFVLSVKK